MSFVLLGNFVCNESARPASRKRAMICPSICLLLVLMSPRTPLYRSKAKSQEAYSGPYSLTTDVKCICICMFGVAAALPKSPEIPFPNFAKWASTISSHIITYACWRQESAPPHKVLPNLQVLRRDKSMKTVRRGYQRPMPPFCRSQSTHV